MCCCQGYQPFRVFLPAAAQCLHDGTAGSKADVKIGLKTGILGEEIAGEYGTQYYSTRTALQHITAKGALPYFTG